MSTQIKNHNQKTDSSSQAQAQDQTKSSLSSSSPETLIDTSKMSPGERAALEMTESARETSLQETSFVADLFMGRFDPNKIYADQIQSDEDKDQGDAFLEKLSSFLKKHVDPDEIDQTGEIPESVIKGLAEMGAFGIKIRPQYGGLGLSQQNYCRTAEILGSTCGNLTALVSAHQSIGVPQPLIRFGTEEQKQKYLPRIAKGEISAFALTESGAGSDPAKMKTSAKPSEDGKHFVINGEKLWCTNGLKAGVIVVMARTPDKVVNGRKKKQITAFIVEMDTPGIEIKHRCRFMGLKALYNGVIHFKDVRVPKENIILAEGKGLKVALTTLNTGRLTLPAACTGNSKKCLEIVRNWAVEREQWGSSIGKHSAIADKIGKMSAEIFAMESMVMATAQLVDRNKHADIRLEAAMSKMWGSEKAWEHVDNTMQIRGGRGYETAQSLKNRGEKAVPIERMMRDCRINLIFEGSSEIMRLFIMREALDPHLKIGAAVFNTRLSLPTRLKAFLKASFHYVIWYPCLWNPFGFKKPYNMNSKLAKHLKYVAKTSKRLARSLFHQMIRFGPKLDKQQVLLGRFADIGTELFAISASCCRAQAMLRLGKEPENLFKLMDVLVKNSKIKIDHSFKEIRSNNDRKNYSVAQSVLQGKYKWLEEGKL